MPTQPLQAPDDLQNALRAVSKSCRLSATPVIFSQGEPARGIYLVESGSIKLSFQGEHQGTVYERVLGSGSLLGLPATINGAPYSATATVTEDSELAFVSREELLGLMMRNPTVAMTILRLLSQEIHDMREVIVGNTKSLGHRAVESSGHR